LEAGLLVRPVHVQAEAGNFSLKAPSAALETKSFKEDSIRAYEILVKDK